MRKNALRFVMGGACLLAACATDDTPVTSTTRVDSEDLYATLDEVPDCTPALSGTVVAVQAENSFFECNGDRWVRDREGSNSSEDSADSSKTKSPGKWTLESNGEPTDIIPDNSGKTIVEMSSSSREPFDIVDKPMSSATIIVDPFPESSSEMEIVMPATMLGACAPAKTPVYKGDAVAWKFVANMNSEFKAMDFAKGTYEWTFGAGASVTTDQTPGTSAKVTYSESGMTTATLKLTVNGQTELIACEPLQVFGSPIVDCNCTTEKTTVDYTESPSVTWAVSGCTSAANITSYTWNGEAGTESFTRTFDAATASYAPTLKVANDDNTIVDVKCPAVKVTEGAEYYLDKESTKIELPAGESRVVLNLPPDWHFATEGSCTLICSGKNQQITITVDGQTSKTGYVTSLSIPIAQTMNNSEIVIGLDAEASCRIEY